MNKKVVVTLLLVVVVIVLQAVSTLGVFVGRNETYFNFTTPPSSVFNGRPDRALNNSFVNGSYNLTLNVNNITFINILIVNITFMFTNTSGNVTIVGVLNQTNITNNATINFTVNTSRLADGLYNITANITNTTGDEFQAFANNITLDNNAPVIGLNITNGSWLNNNNTILNWTAVDATDTLNCTLVIDGAVNSTGIVTANNTRTSQTIYVASSGIHNYTVNCTDIYTNHNGSAPTVFYWYMTNNPPSFVEVFTPLNVSTENYINRSFNVTFRARDNVDPNNLTCSIIVNQTFINITVTNILNNTNVSRVLQLADNASVNLSVNCSNSGYGISNVSRTENLTGGGNFTTNGASPVVLLVQPTDGTSTQVGEFVFTCNATDQRLTNFTLERTAVTGTITSFTTNQTNSSPSGTSRTNATVNFSVTNHPADTIIWNCQANDTGLNYASAAANLTFYRSVVIEPSGGGGSGGGGGGGRGSTLAKKSTFSLSSDGSSQALVAYSRMVKSVTLPDGSLTSVTVTRVYNNEKAFVMVGDQEYELFEGQSAVADVNGDGTADLEVTLQDSFLTKAHLTLRAVQTAAALGIGGETRDDSEKTGYLGGQEAFAEAVDNTLGTGSTEGAEAVAADAPSNEVTGQAVVDAEPSSVWSMIGILALVLAGIGGYYWYYRPSNSSRKK